MAAILRGKAATMPTFESQLSLTGLITRAGRLHPTGQPTRNQYSDFEPRARRLASALRARGIGCGDTVATLMFNNFEHCLIFYTLALMGVCVAPLNRSERPSKLDFMVDLVRPKLLFVDGLFVGPILNEMRCSQDGSLPTVVCNASSDPRSLGWPTLSDFVRSQSAVSDGYPWPRLDENTALGVGFTSGSTGNPKCVVYSHKSMYLYTLECMGVDTMALSSLDVMMPLPPFFHATGWGMPWIALTTGANYVLYNDVSPGVDLIPHIAAEGVTFMCGVPAVLTALKNAAESDSSALSKLQSLQRVLTGGTAPSISLANWYENEVKCSLISLWGMTEAMPCVFAPRYVSREDLGKPEEQLVQNQLLCGLPNAGVQLRIVDPDDFAKELPWDGKSRGLLLVTGPHTIVSYFAGAGSDKFWTDPETGRIWLNTGDIAVRTERGQMAIVDRQKDVIKSGGEWISSKELENELMNLPNLAEVAVVAVFSEQWAERPVAVATLKPGAASVSEEEMRAHFARNGFRKFEIPDRLLIWDELPHLGSGKLAKVQVRQRLLSLGFRMPVSVKVGPAASKL